MPYIPADVVSRAKQMDRYTYLRNFEAQELVHVGGGTYCTREHDSLKISDTVLTLVSPTGEKAGYDLRIERDTYEMTKR